MYFLPVIERELRVATRKRATYRLRVIAAVIGLVIGLCLLLIHQLAGGGAGRLGQSLFSILTWLGFVSCISAGVFFTSDCISEEKREGTLGFLFLTDLRGIDVVLGKVMATSLRSAFALFAIFPVLGITLLMGGVEGKQFWQTSMAMVMALACSLTAGVFISTLSRKSQHAVSGTFFLLLAWAAVGPVMDLAVREAWARPGFTRFSFSSPLYAFVSATARGGLDFGVSILGNCLIVSLLLGAAAFLAPRTWQQKQNRSFGRAARAIVVTPRAGRRRQRLLAQNPFLWLAQRERWQGFGAWLIAGLALVILLVLWAMHVPSAGWNVWNAAGGMLVMLLYLWTASQASRLFVDLRKNGVLELLITTPLRVPEMVQGQWLALLKTLGPPAVLLVAAQTVGTTFAFESTWGMIRQQAGQPGPQRVVALITAGVTSLAVLGNLAALSWFGMWSGLNSKSNNQAALKSILWVQIVPWFIISFVSSIGTMLLVMPNILRSAGKGNVALAFTSSLFPVLSVAVPASLSITKDILFIFWSRNRLYSRLRDCVVAGEWSPAPPRAWFKGAPPPVIPPKP